MSEDVIEALELLYDRLFPICRSLTGDGVRETLNILSEIAKLQTFETPSGKRVYDWEIPKEWNVRQAFIENEDGLRLVDFNDNNLHLVGYSSPIEKWFSREELNQHLHSDEKLTAAIPYVTSYYRENWGFCITHEEREKLFNGDKFFVKIDTELKNGSLTWGQAYLKGHSEKEFLFSTYICHPSLANNELSGPLVSIFLLQKLMQEKKLNYSYRFIFVPETIGAINFIDENIEHLKENLIGGLVLTCIGDSGSYTYKKTLSGNTFIDYQMRDFLKITDGVPKGSIIDYFPWGSDERQYNSPGLRFPVGCLCRTMYGRYPEYHTSLDNKNIMDFEKMSQTISDLYDLVLEIDNTWLPENTNGICEPKLDKYGLYRTTSQTRINYEETNAIRWCLALGDGQHSAQMIAQQSGINIELIEKVSKNLLDIGLLK